MDWDGALRPFVEPGRPAESSFGFVYHHDITPSEVTGVERPETKGSRGRSDRDNKAKKKMSNGQLETLEESFREGMKLDPDRKMKLSRGLGLEPRQVAVWFQNRQARWKGKQMEALYAKLRQEFDVTCKEKLRLQEEAVRLKSILQG